MLQTFELLDRFELLASINKLLETSLYSDFDYNLLPNKDPVTKDMTPGEASEHISSIYQTLKSDMEAKSESDPQGFTLFRVKSSVMCEVEQPDLDQTLKAQKNNCYDAKNAGVIDQNLIDRLMPQLINREDRNIAGLQHSNWNLCKQYIEHLLAKKQKIAIATQFNVYTAINYISENITLEKIAKGKYSLTNDDLELESIIYYINYNTYHLNEVIKKWENGNFKNSGGGIVSKPYLEVCQSFISLYTIINSSYLLSIIGSIIAQYLNFPDSHTADMSNPLSISYSRTRDMSKPLSEKILEKIERDIKYSGIIECQSAKMLPSKITLVNSTGIKEFGAVMKRDLKQPLQTLRFSDVGFPDGINIVLNIISPDIPRPTPSTSLEELFDGLKIHTVEGPENLVRRDKIGGGKKSRKSRTSRKPRKPRKPRKSRKSTIKERKKQNKTRKK